MSLAGLKTVSDYRRLFTEKSKYLYDDSPSYAEQTRPKLNKGLSDSEVDDAIFWYPHIRGVMLVSGPPGAGKGLFSSMLSWKAKRYYEDKIVILDYKPRELFGFYIPFTKDMLIEQLERMKEAAGWDSIQFENMEEVGKFDKNQSKRWSSSRGEIFLNNSVMVLDEFHEYMDRRTRPPIGLILGDIFKFWRHLNLLCIGVTTRKGDLDYKRFQKAMTAEVRCSWAKKAHDERHSSTIYKLQPMKYDDAEGGVVPLRGRLVKKRIDGAKPREILGGEGYFDLFNSVNVKGISIPNSLKKEVRREEKMREEV